MNKTFYMVMRLRSWQDLEIQAALFLPNQPPKTSAEFGQWFCCVFDSWEEAEEHAGGYPVVVMQEGEKSV